MELQLKTIKYNLKLINGKLSSNKITTNKIKKM